VPHAWLQALDKVFLKKMNFPLPSVLLEALGKEFFKKKIVLLFAERQVGGARQRNFQKKLFCSLPSVRLEAPAKKVS